MSSRETLPSSRCHNLAVDRHFIAILFKDIVVDLPFFKFIKFKLQMHIKTQ